MKTTITKKLLILLISGMFSFSIANAQFICDCSTNQPGSCHLDSHGHMKCFRIPNHCGGCTRIDQNESGSSLQVYFNPGSNSTSILFSLEQSQKVTLRIFDMSGRLVSIPADRVFEAGDTELAWNADNIPSGIYLLQFESAENTETIKIAVTK